jgi:hypothetical protein
MKDQIEPAMSLLTRLRTATACFWRSVREPEFARSVGLLLEAKPSAQPKTLQPTAQERVHSSGLWILSMLQREGRLIDFLQEDIASFPDADIGAAARAVHSGCRKVLTQYLSLEAVLKDAEGATVKVEAGFDAQRIRLTGNVAGQPPFRGALKHHGWIATAVRLPLVSDAVDPRVLAPAEIELP